MEEVIVLGLGMRGWMAVEVSVSKVITCPISVSDPDPFKSGVTKCILVIINVKVLENDVGSMLSLLMEKDW